MRSAEYDTIAPIATTGYLIHNALMPISKYYKNTLGYIPCDKEWESVAKGLEYAYNDWCISLLAEAVGDTATHRVYAQRGKNYQNYYDASTGFMRGKDLKGEWRTPFNPNASTHRTDDYCEGNAWQWTWFVPHDIEGLADLMGGREQMLARLDTLFTTDAKLEGEMVSADISGLIGQYAHGNEPSHHIIFMYNKLGPVYSIGRPLYDAVTIQLPEGKTFRISTVNNAPANKYIQSATLNGAPLDTPFFDHETLMQGGTLELTMTDKPTEWGTGK